MATVFGIYLGVNRVITKKTNSVIWMLFSLESYIFLFIKLANLKVQ